MIGFNATAKRMPSGDPSVGPDSAMETGDVVAALSEARNCICLKRLGKLGPRLAKKRILHVGKKCVAPNDFPGLYAFSGGIKWLGHNANLLR